MQRFDRGRQAILFADPQQGKMVLHIDATDLFNNETEM